MSASIVAYAVAWAGAGQSHASPFVVHSISSVVTVALAAGLFWLTRSLEREDARRVIGRIRAAHILPFPIHRSSSGRHQVDLDVPLGRK